ncbi:MAG: hypothetical protein L0271_20790 [Gemmatimonadetes bacterium]|nr:hypothetical protein [Gemmatimonadota bacterium]
MLDIRLGPPIRYANLTILPLFTARDIELPYLLLGDAIASGALRITEVGSGSVPRLLAKNAADADVLILDGEQLIGARQNRMTNRSILLPAGSETEIPVSCMEQGRWRFESDAFGAAPQHSPAKVRRKAREVEASALAVGMMPSEGVLATAQGAIWDEIGEVSMALRSGSPTGALDAAYHAAGPDLEERVRRFPRVEGQVGLTGLVSDRPIGLDIIGGRALYARLHERLLRGYVLDALEAQSRGEAGVPNSPADAGTGIPVAATRFAESVRDAERTHAPSVGRGRYAVVTGDVIGGELTDDAFDPHRTAHICAFPLTTHPATGQPRDPVTTREGPIAPPSRRRRT